MDHADQARVFRAFCDENRLAILEQLRGGERCVCKLLESLEITQPTLSHHLAILREAGVVQARRDGKWMHYSLDSAGLDTARAALERIASAPFAYAETGCACAQGMIIE